MRDKVEQLQADIEAGVAELVDREEYAVATGCGEVPSVQLPDHATDPGRRPRDDTEEAQ
jgi:hypothetical protein